MPRIAFTLGEPAGIGPDLAVLIARENMNCSLAVIGDPDLLRQRAGVLALPLGIDPWRGRTVATGALAVVPERLQQPSSPGVLNRANVGYVLRCLDRAIDGCISGEFDAMVTGPIHKGVINDAGTCFTGHTEYIARRTGASLPVMMLTTPNLRVALVTTHVPLSGVSALITRDRLSKVIGILLADLKSKFGLATPRIAVCGLNPHAGEQGHLGREEVEIIGPVIESYRDRGHLVDGPLPADTVFIPGNVIQYDAVLSMYHDQGLPVIKQQGFDQAVNLTLGIPIVRTSVDHGTALRLAGTSAIRTGSTLAAIALAVHLAKQRAAGP